ncbi:aspartate--tRNA ligase [Bartonella bacilliformis]|uniref:Aspartate--tRNA(Asp/Asn) ligase n=2 Tax=Bartonella bacilliformis TaxID=774 RepID=SYDND_BARBK|nr:aspartate--tRNA ligase [Bartonella bacilliformis]A1UT52.1 RecName: Full=Aspartate--tRNA(Asp/Asn) ligase; AltName: Full=Aspartyl-tRNA synthetase; Short=AspRS; AltName: Full=Non-discriminating aspartyl-tRNA synthetase; Short=ND-AspRS [Bartonella bacilliformis KC583]ABM44906.1 aspartyl-tRNA synthetase [Bartonella bacilliformis KC583]AMG85941.1 aspartate--tRNA(Asp/Asn) ligase [Bartonella bacilliformis]EKS43840.1 aspartyl-tRNA ligase [Bartonella bacilliformis INS]EYS89841.1 aspartyl-tRNA synthet
MHRYRSHNCAALRKCDVGTQVRLSGWVHRVRDHGGILFVDLRDHFGITQIVVNPDSSAFQIMEKVRSEWVICVDGKVCARSDEVINTTLPTGEIEIFADEIEILSKSDELPLPVFGEPDYPEDIRLKYRFLDLRRVTMHKNIMRRTEIISSIRRHMQDSGFTEFTTPLLTASSPEGARDFLVPSRIHQGKFYALPQAPQQYKQLLMMSGFDRYFQIAPCFRDEDPRADRLPGEFYQLDIEMSFVEQEDVLATMEPIIRSVFEEFSDGKLVTQSFPRISYDEAMRKYGSDKPDLRNPIIIEDVSQHFYDSDFKVFAQILANNENAQVWAIPAKTGGNRAFCDRMNGWAQGEGQPGLGYIFWRKEGENFEGAGPIAKNIGEQRTEAIRTQLGLKEGDACFFVAGDPKKFASFAGASRTRIGEELDLIDSKCFSFAWIVDFPFFEWNEDEKKIDFAHNPFSMPQGGMNAVDSQDPLTIKAFQYDLVCNGYEIASGGIRNHSPEMMLKVFNLAGLSREIVEERFGGLYRAFHYGAPPHGGMAAGVDRIVMLLQGVKNLREISLFPMNQQALDLLMSAPSDVSATQLNDLGIRIFPKVNNA